MIHYHGLPITPLTAAVKVLEGGHGFLSFAHPEQLSSCVAFSQSFAVDNGAFSAWKAGKPIKDWSAYYQWVKQCQLFPSCDFAVIPDVIDGNEEDNDVLLEECPLPRWFGAPVWHMHESFKRLERLALAYPRICLGSSGDYSVVGNDLWWNRMSQAMRVICNDEGQPLVKLHGLRMLNPAVFTKLPLSSADSTNIGRSVGIDQKWAKGNYLPPTKEARAQVMRTRIEAFNSPPCFDFTDSTSQLGLFT